MRFLILTILYLFIALQIVIAQFININITNNSSDQTEPYISINPLNKSHVFAVYHDYSGGTDCKAGYGFSTDKGSTWNKGVLWGPPNSNYYFGIDPSVSIDNNGRVFYTYFARPAQNEGSKFLGLVYTVYTDNNGTYWNYTSVDPDNNDVDKPFMCIDNSGSIYDGRIYVCWVDVTDNDIIKFSYSSDRGESFISPPYELDESSSVMSGNIDLYPSETNKIITEDRVGSPMPMVGPDGELYVFWYDADDIQGFNGCIFEMAKSQDGGRTFSYPITISNFTFRFGNYGALEYASFISFVSIDPITGYIYIVYSDQYSQSNTNLKIKFVRSTNGGENWESPMIIGDLGAGQHLMPCMSVDKSGKLSVMFLHYTNTQFLKTYIIESFDHGNNFLEPILVSSGISNPNVSINKNHYNGIFNSVGGDSYCVWTDYRDNTANIYYSLVNSLDYYSEENKSVDQNATAGNNGRKVVRDGSGNYHIVFSSGGEIFYHKTTDGGSSWLEPVRLSESNGFNSYPSISESSGNIYATWQRNTNGNDYDVYFAASTDNGSTWGNKYVLVNRSSAEGPRPVIQSKYTNSMIILQSNSGLDAFLTESTNPSAGSWRRTPDLPGYSTSYSPTLTTGLQ
ncbi:MAG: glycoside hydrolase, partial [Melioribacteraceae bacterium]|nr:glycoside hydrolase [Melioribacteraceae bacterium]